MNTKFEPSEGSEPEALILEPLNQPEHYLNWMRRIQLAVVRLGR
jgi:hypothetical protein